MELKVIVTGTTGMVGEGVLLECLENKNVKQVLSAARHPSGIKHSKLKELIVPDFMQLETTEADLKGYNACFFCAGVSSLGMKEAQYTRITYDTTLHFAKILAALNPGLVFCYISGQGTDSAENGKLMWARVKGKTENDLMQLPGIKAYNFRPGVMEPTAGQQHLKPVYRMAAKLIPVFRIVFPRNILTLQEVASAMINSALSGYQKQVLEIKDIKELAAG